MYEIATKQLGFIINTDCKIDTDKGRVLVKTNTILIDRDLMKERIIVFLIIHQKKENIDYKKDDLISI